MSVSGGIDRRGGPGQSVAARLLANLTAWGTGLFGTARARPVPLAPLPISRLALGVAATIAAVAFAMLVLDSWAVAHHGSIPVVIIAVFEELSDFGRSNWFLLPSGIALVVIATTASPALGRMAFGVLTSLAARLGFVFIAVALPSLVVTIGKRLIGRARPLRGDHSDFYFMPFAWRSEFASMPSGHSTTAFAAAVALGALFPRARAALWIYAALIALSRVILIAHYASDVVAGAVVGACGALLVRRWFAARRIAFGVTPDGTIRAMPGPSLRRIKRVAGRLLGQ